MSRNGRAMTIEWDSVVLAGVRTKGYTVTNDYVDVTSDDDAGWQTLLSDPGTRAVEATAGGITKNQTLLGYIMAAQVTSEPLTMQLPTTTGTLSGNFLVSSYSDTGEHDGAVEFEATFMSTGPVVYTPGVSSPT